MVLVDEYSRYNMVAIVLSVSVNSPIPELDKVLAMFLYPEVIKSDNGSPFNSDALKQSGFFLRIVTECWPREMHKLKISINP